MAVPTQIFHGHITLGYFADLCLINACNTIMHLQITATLHYDLYLDQDKHCLVFSVVISQHGIYFL